MREPLALSEIVIAGGGPAGAAAACQMAPTRRVVLLEREAGPAHKVCGEFISGEALGELTRLGVDVAALGGAPIGAVRLVHRGRTATAKLPFAAAGLSRLVLDEALLRRAASLGAGIERAVRVRSVAPGEVHTQSGVVRARTTLLAIGKHDLRGMPRLPPGKADPLIGFKLHLRLRAAQQAELAGHVEIILFEGGYAGLQMVEDGAANLCLLADRSRFGADWAALLATLEHEDTHLARRLDGAVPVWPKPLSIFRVPYGFIHRGPDMPGVFRLGDQAAVIPSFCGDGMAIALHSARLAAATIQAGRGEADYHRAIRNAAGPPVRLAHRLYRLTRSHQVRELAITAARHWPGLLSGIATHTRVASAS